MNKSVISVILILTAGAFFSCTDRGFTKFKKNVFFNNQSGQGLNIFFYDTNENDTIHVDNLEKYHYGIFELDAFLPINFYDSVLIQFEDLKTIKYLPTDCSMKNIFCTSTYYCITGDTSDCQFIIDVDEYLKAK